MSDDSNKLVRVNMTLDKDTLKCIAEYANRMSLDKRSQAVRHIFKEEKKNYEDNRSTEEEGS